MWWLAQIHAGVHTVGPNEAALGPRFPDMSTAYCPELRGHARAAAQDCGVDLKEGV
jgi:purine-nucleoside phosphorylase|eukprot:COSAG01_NODE_16628_length_1219_cov_128.411607_2_plen_56_part_00